VLPVPRTAFASQAASTLKLAFSSMISERLGREGSGTTNILSGDPFVFNDAPCTSYGNNDAVINGNQDSQQSSAGGGDPLGPLGDIGDLPSRIAAVLAL
jgi:hypothetical protein